MDYVIHALHTYWGRVGARSTLFGDGLPEATEAERAGARAVHETLQLRARAQGVSALPEHIAAAHDAAVRTGLDALARELTPAPAGDVAPHTASGPDRAEA